MIININKHFWIALCLLIGLFALPAAAQTTVTDDDVLVYVDSEQTINVLANDNLGSCLDARVEVLTHPSTGTAAPSSDGRRIVYIPSGTTAYNTSFTYQVKCSSGILGSATVNVKVIVRPENISTADCYVTPQGTAWDIELKAISDQYVHAICTPLAGDIDKDGHIEVVVPNCVYDDNEAKYANGIIIFDDKLKTKKTFTTPLIPQYSTTNLLLGDVNNDGYGEIIIAAQDAYLYCYDYNGNQLWKSTATITLRTSYECPSLITADINADGYAEILAVDKIFDGATGQHLVTLPTGGRGYSVGGPPSYMPVFADFDNDGILEVAAGNTVYNINITNRTSTSGNSVSIYSSMPSYFDGFTSVADIDLDGKLDVIVTGSYSGATMASLYVWNPRTSTLIGNAITIPSAGARISRAFVGDIDKDGKPDIAFTYTQTIEAYSYDAVSNTFVNMFSKTTTDASGATTMSLFDFNQDGNTEIVYRDETDLRIIDKNGNNLTTIPCFSGTHTEYPIIVDINLDGHAEIIVTGTVAGASLASQVSLRCYGSVTPKAWAPARPVWNQHAYNAVNINNDLSIPRHQLNPATVFPGEDGLLGTADDMRPYNNFLQQQTMLNKVGNPLWLAPDAKIMTNPTYLSYSAPNITISNVVIKNIGEAALSGPLYISLYKNRTVSTANLLGSVQISVNGLAVNEEKRFDNIILAITESVAANNLLIRVNDNNGNIFHPECDITNNASPIVRNFWKGTTDTDWGTSTNWTANLIPYPGENVEFATESNNPTQPGDPNSGPAINDLVLDQDRNIGNLINESDKSTIIPPSLSLIIEGKVTGSETASDADKIQIQADADNPNGSLILSCANQNTDVYASVQMYARGSKGTTAFWTDNITGSPTSGTVYESSYSWQYFGVPVEEVKAYPTFDGAFAKVYNESQNAANSFYGKWTSLTNNVMMNAFKGYEITQDEPTVYSIQGKLVFCDQNVILTRMAPAVNGAYGANERYGLGQNIIGNSFTAAIPVDKINFTPGVEETVYLYNTGRFSDWGDETGNQPDGTINANATTAGNYRAIPKNTASAHPYRNIPSMQGFLLWYKGVDDTSVTQTLPYADLTGNDKPQTAPQASLSYLEVTLNSASTVDKLWLFSQAGTGAGFDNGWDGRKFFGTPTAFIFAPTPDGHMQVSTSENIIGSYISFVGNTEKNYTLSLRKSNLDGKYPTLYLADLKTKEVVLLKDEITHYSFTADNVGTAEKRFRIKNTADIGGCDLQQLYALLVDNKIQLTNNSNTAAVFSLYDTMGHLVEYRSVEGMSVDMFSKSLVPGVYIVKMTAGGADVNQKIVVSTN